MEQKFDNNNTDIEVLREFCEREDKGGDLPQGRHVQ